MNRVATPTISTLLTTSLLALMASSSAWATEDYVVTASTTLALEDEQLVQRYTVDCVATDAGVNAALTTNGRDVRFWLAPEQAVASGVDDTVHAVDEPLVGSWSAAPVPGARVFARLTARCGTAGVFHEIVVDSAPVVVPAVLTVPASLQRTDDLRVVARDTLPVGVEVELVGLGLHASPRGDEVVTVVVEGAGVAMSFDVTAADVEGGNARLAPTFTATATGEVTVTAQFLESVSEPITFIVVDEEVDADIGVVGGTDTVSSCAAAPASTTAFAALLLVLRRRRR